MNNLLKFRYCSRIRYFCRQLKLNKGILLKAAIPNISGKAAKPVE